jgi:hypothetical protein
MLGNPESIRREFWLIFNKNQDGFILLKNFQYAAVDLPTH